MLLLYAKQITPRLRYTARFVFKDILQTEVLLTSDKSELAAFEGPKVNYSDEDLCGMKLHPRTLLFRHELTRLDVNVHSYQGLPFLFSVSKPSALPFDPLAAIFYMISRYEEYGPRQVDRHGRFKPSSSIAYKQGFLEIPVVDRWAYLLKDEIEKAFPTFKFPKREYTFLPTYDIDMVWAYRNKGRWRTIGSFIRSALKFDFKDIQTRYQILFKNAPDPFDTFAMMHEWHTERNLAPIIFFQVGPYGKYDKNTHVKNEDMQNMIRNTQRNCEVGVHPSYQSNRSLERLDAEINTLGYVTREPVVRSRQHFLILQLPDTYLSLISCGIREDYTMGNASYPGFRAGTCTPFRFFDLTSNTETMLTIYPFAVMDVTLKQYMKLSPSEALHYVERLIKEIKKVDGMFCTLWHNESLSEIRDWKGWRQMYIHLLDKAKVNETEPSSIG